MPRQAIRNLGVYGVIRQAEVDDHLIPEGAVTEVQNFHFDRKGTATTRPGVTLLGTTGVIQFGNTWPCLGMHNHKSSLLIAAFASTTNGTISLYRLSSDQTTWVNWQDITTTGLSTQATDKVRFIDFSGGFIVLTGTYASMLNATFTSDTVFTGYGSLGVSSFPTSDVTIRPKFAEVYKSRVYLAGDPTYTSRLYFSSVVDNTPITSTTGGKITWTPSTDYVDINPGDAEGITGLKRYSLELLVFKPNYMYRFRTSGLDPDPMVKLGTRSHESVVEGKRGVYFHHDTGFYRYTGNYPEEISRPVIDFVNAIPFSRYPLINSWIDQDHIYWSIGNVTIPETLGNVTWYNVVLRYTESSDLWTIYSYQKDIRKGLPYLTATSSSIAIGLDNGTIAEFNRGGTDLGEPIKYRMVTKWYELGDVENRKAVLRLVALCEKARDANLMYQIDDSSEWKTLGQLSKYLNYFPPGPSGMLNIKLHRIRFKISGVSNGEAMMFQGIILTDTIDEGYIK